MNELEMDQETKERIIDESNLAFKFNMEVFTELEEEGKRIKEEVLGAGFPGHGHGDMDGDINKCPYYAAKMVASGNTNFTNQLAMMLLRHPVGQKVLASWAAAIAGLAAWYLM